MTNLLLTHGYIITVDASRRVLADGWIHIRNDRIAGIGSMGDEPTEGAGERLDMRGMVVMPGLINGHNHHFGNLFKNTGEGLYTEPWLDTVFLPLLAKMTNADFETAAYLGALEQIRTGTTCTLNHVVNLNDEASLRAMLEPVLRLGVRQFATKELRETPVPPFAPAAPNRPHVRSRADELSLAETLIDEWQGRQGLIHMGLAIETGANWMLHNSTSAEIVTAGWQMAHARDLRITNHSAAGTAWLSIQEFRKRTGNGDVEYLSRMGVLDDRWILVHGTHLTDPEVEIIGRSGASVITNPVSNAYGCQGVAPVPQMLAAGVNVGIGTDGTYVNCTPDMLEQMKFEILIQNVSHLDPTLLNAETVIEMATINNARAMGLEHEIGSLEVGKRADIAVFDLSRAHTTVVNRPVSALVFAAHGTDVDTVIVNGEVLLRGGRLTRFHDEEAVLADASGRASRIIAEAGLEHRVEPSWRSRHATKVAHKSSVDRSSEEERLEHDRGK
jgi:5-methylthioadenosine/S-adenosylhomocysteine deaminase